ncbi:NADPH-dependent FMN reductase [Tenacibaculum sp.]|uniref:NADPH-dependent FMN reductase n=1 Tax=Tenacibaculum sp. TaxID=1906242 RepID=UPI003D09AF05
MNTKLKIIGICGSASRNSGNLSILKHIANSEKSEFDIEIIEDLTQFPHFRTELTDEDTPEEIVTLRNKIHHADGIIICTPEYVFSIPSGLKNIIEWCVSTTVFSDKPTGLITASANGEKGHEELKLIMETIQANFTENTTLLIQGIKGKVSREGDITNEVTEEKILDFITSFKKLVKKQQIII